jgi:hypothetical protein
MNQCKVLNSLKIKIISYGEQYLMKLPYLLTPWSRVLLEKLTGLQLVKKFPAFYGTRKFITAFTSARHLIQLNPVHIHTSHFLKIHLMKLLALSTSRNLTNNEYSIFTRAVVMIQI